VRREGNVVDAHLALHDAPRHRLDLQHV
jgi:hypothetical protein